MPAPDAQYVIDVAADMPAGDKTTAELDALTEGLLGGGKNAEFFSTAMVGVSKQLDAASAAAKIANGALAEAEAEHESLQRAADKAAGALEKALSAGKVEATVFDKLVLAAGRSNDSLIAHASKLQSVQAAATAATTAQTKLSGTLDNLRQLNTRVNNVLGESGERWEKIRGVIAQAGGPIGQLGSKLLGPVQGFSKLSAGMGSFNAAAILGVASFAAVAAAAAAAYVALGVYGIKQADSTRNTRLATEAMQAIHPELKALTGTFESLTAETGAHADELQELSGRLREAKVAAADIPAVLRAAALSEAALGSGGANDFINDLKTAKGGARALADEVSGKLAPIVAQQMRGLSAQTERLQKNLSDTFGGLNIEPLLDGASRLVGLLDQNSASGQTLKFVFESMFQPAIDGADDASIRIEAFVLQTEILGLKAYLAFKPYATELEVLGHLATTLLNPIGALTGAFDAGASAGKGDAQALRSAWSGMPEVGKDAIAGLISGILGGGPAVNAAMAAVSAAGVQASRDELGIHSPSTVMMGVADNTTDGFVNQIQDRAPEAQAATAALVDPTEALRQAQLSGDVAAITALQGPPGPAAAAPAAPAQAASGAGKFNGATFILQGGSTEEQARDFIELVTQLDEADARQAGA